MNQCAWLVSLAVLISCHATPLLAAADRPNIVLIMADDVGYGDFGCFGGEIQTPNIDRLAREGLSFTRFYNNSVCVPTRFSLLTGLYPRYPAPAYRIALSGQTLTVAEALRAAGYRTSLSGKWHLGAEKPNRPIDRGFEEFYGLMDGCCNYHNPARQDPKFEGGRFRVWGHNDARVTEFPKDFYATDAITDHAVKQIQRFAASKEPFFVHICYTAAHSPLHAKPADMAKYKGKYAAGWDELRRQRRQRQLDLGLIDAQWPVAPREPEVIPWEKEPLKEWHENLMAVYAAMVDCMDQGVGRILKTLEETGTDRNTLVLVLSDNGGCAEQAGGDDPTNIAGPVEHYVACGPGWAYAQNTPLRRYKGWTYEGGIATPLIARWPGVAPAGKRTPHVGHVIDLLPTLAEVAGAKLPDTRDGAKVLPPEGQSLVPILKGGARPAPQTLYWATFGHRAVCEGRWKLVWEQDARRWELYDLDADRAETRDLAADQPERVKRMTLDWEGWAERTGGKEAGRRPHRLKLTPAKP
jgi:arylsulfatase A-like enzyme